MTEESDTEIWHTVGIRECTICGRNDPNEEFGVEGLARIQGNICVECAHDISDSEVLV